VLIAGIPFTGEGISAANAVLLKPNPAQIMVHVSAGIILRIFMMFPHVN